MRIYSTRRPRKIFGTKKNSGQGRRSDHRLVPLMPVRGGHGSRFQRSCRLDRHSIPIGRGEMTHREQIRELARSVGHGLTAYIDVHNEIFHEGFTFKSVIKNLFGRGVPMSKFLADAEALVPLWTSLRREIARFRASAESVLKADEREYLDLLSRYVAAIETTVAALVERQGLLCERSKTVGGDSVTWEAFQTSGERYEAAVAGYMALGDELNQAQSLVFDD